MINDGNGLQVRSIAYAQKVVLRVNKLQYVIEHSVCDNTLHNLFKFTIMNM